jgi:DNA-binding NarL/FixJ family response regulator
MFHRHSFTNLTSLFREPDFRSTELALKINSTQPLLIPLSQDSEAEAAPRIIVHLAMSDTDLEKSVLSLLGRNNRFTVVPGSIGYAADSDVRIIDEIPDIDQLRAFDELDPPKLLYLGFEESDEALIEAVRAGAWSFLSETADSDDLEQAICTLYEATGSPLLEQIASSASASEALLHEFSKLQRHEVISEVVHNPLTDSEIELLGLIARGEPSKAIGNIVGLGEQTVKNYVVKIFEKTHTQNRAHAAALAAQRGWLTPLDHG